MSDAEKKKRGRPAAKQNLLSHPLAHSFIKDLIQRGATNKEIAKRLLVSERTWINWKNANSDFLHSLMKKEELDDAGVENALLKLALGYEKEVPTYDAEGNVIAIEIKHIPPNAAAIQFYLKNRKSEKWRDKIDIAASMEQIPVRINFKRKENVIEAESKQVLEAQQVEAPQAQEAHSPESDHREGCDTDEQV